MPLWVSGVLPEAPRAVLRVTLDVPFQLAVFVSGLLAGHRRELGNRDGTRALTQPQPRASGRSAPPAVMLRR
jgi:hypothetical protein